MNLFSRLKRLRRAIVQKATPLARLYIRFSPLSIGKLFLFKRFFWREYNYVARTKFGDLMKGRSNDVVQGYIYYFGVWEPNLSAFINERLKEQPNRTFVDVGANVGYFTLIAARLLKNGGVVAIEPFPSIYKTLEANLQLNNINNVRLIPRAASDVDQNIQMFYGDPINEGATTSVAGKFKNEPVIVRGEPLSNLLTEQEIKSIRLIKIDVEGAEYSVIQGMRQIIQKLPDDAEILVEISPSANGQEHLADIFSIFELAGFLPYEIFNSYDPNYYIQPHQNIRPFRIQTLPTQQTDVIFSKNTAKHL
jgi:FkbM family methyltransferase